MRLTRYARLRYRRFTLPMRHRFEAAHGTLEDNPGVLVELTDADGYTGIGEASPVPSLGAGTADDVARLIEEHGASLLTSGAWTALALAAPGAAAMRCALDVAQLDLIARRQGHPVAAILSEEPAPWVTSNAVIGGGPPEEVARFGLEAVEHGYRVLKVKVGVASVEEDARRIAALRETCPDTVIRLDANGGWDEATAHEAINALFPYGIELIEQPVPAADVEALARVREFAPMRIAADEAVHDPARLDRIIELRAADLLVLKPMLLGGLIPAREVARRAASAGIGCFVTTTFDSSIGTAASIQLAAALPVDAAHGLGTGEYLGADVVVETLIPRDGRFDLFAGPGLGIEVDEEALDRVAEGPWVTIED
jgi:L-Ala-D/L-Glu epimerase